ncbi:MAG: type III secretion system gatekeeper subunit SctW [Deltaproteobacteria bacterium]|nr:type III secretion system gatekeeper subunit SctW [Deltaproteobacteria bacterium]
MAIDFSVNNAQNLNQVRTAQDTGASANVGNFMGMAAVEVEDPMSLLEDAAEELTFSVDTTEDFELQERNERDKAVSTRADRVRLYQELMHEAGKARDIDHLKDELRSRKMQENVARHALELFHDPSDAWAALAEALEDLEKDPAVGKDVLDAIQTGMAELEKESGPAIHAGIQGALAAKGYTDLDSSDNLRGFYRQTVCDFGTVNDVFAYVHDTYGDGNFDKAMDFLFGALSADLASDLPSMETTHLEQVHGNLEQVRLLQNVYRDCDRLLGRWESIHHVKDCLLTPMELMGQMVALRNERFLGASQIDQIASQSKAPDIEHEVLFLQEMLSMSRNFPPQLFDGTEGRMKVIDAVQEAVDRAIEREDAYLASLEGEG